MNETPPSSPALSFERLVTAIGQTHADLAAQASRAVNASLTLRNWLIGFHIAEYEQQGTDRAQYGDKLLPQASAGNIRESLTPILGVAAGDVLNKLSFSHIAELLQCDDATKRAFYELECISWELVRS